MKIEMNNVYNLFNSKKLKEGDKYICIDGDAYMGHYYTDIGYVNTVGYNGSKVLALSLKGQQDRFDYTGHGATFMSLTQAKACRTKLGKLVYSKEIIELAEKALNED